MKLKGMTAIFALALIVVAAAPTLALHPGVASAASGVPVQAAFTKWVLFDYTHMVGVVGGQVGNGTFAGEILSYNDNGTTTTINAVYHINGSKESFVANNAITVNDATGIADITGVVTSGSLIGATVDGAYKTKSPCPIPTPGNVYGTTCFSGTLNVTP